MFSAWCHLTYVVFSAAFHLPRRSDVGTGKDHAAVARSRLEPGHCSTCGSLSEPQILHMGSTKFYSFTTVYMHCCHLGLWRWVWCFFSYSNYQVGNLTWGAIPVEYSHTNEAENQLLNIYSSLVLPNTTLNHLNRTGKWISGGVLWCTAAPLAPLTLCCVSRAWLALFFVVWQGTLSCRGSGCPYNKKVCSVSNSDGWQMSKQHPDRCQDPKLPSRTLHCNKPITVTDVTHQQF